MKNTTQSVLAFRDNDGKHHIQPGESFEVVGEQHMPSVRDAIARAKEEAEPQTTTAPATVKEPRKVPVHE